MRRTKCAMEEKQKFEWKEVEENRNFERKEDEDKPKTERKRDEEKKPQRLRGKARLYIAIALLLLLSLAIVVTVLSQTVFKFRDPNVSVHNVKVQNMSLTFDMLLSLSVSADVQVENSNYYDFKYDNSTVVLTYREKQVGDEKLPGGIIRSRSVAVIPAVIAVEAVKILVTGLQDMTSGVASFVLDAVVPGKIKLAEIYKRRVTAILHCDVEIFISNQTLKHNICKQSILK